MIRVSVVVPTCRRPELLRRCLDALLAQDLDGGFEVLVSDDGDGSAARELSDGFARRAPCGLRVRYVPPGAPRGPAAARNRGWRAASGPVIAFTDDDCVPSPGWLREGLTALSEGFAAVQGRIVVPLPAEPTDYELNASRLSGAVCATANLFCRREALAELGGFDERFTRAWREDSDLRFTLLERRKSFGAAPRAVVVHPVRPGRFAVSLGQQRNNVFEALLFKKHPDLYRSEIGAPPWRYYGILFALLTGLWGAATDRGPAVLAGLAAWSFWTGAFLLERLSGTSRRPAHVAEMVLTTLAIPWAAVFWRLRGALRYRVLFF